MKIKSFSLIVFLVPGLIAGACTPMDQPADVTAVTEKMAENTSEPSATPDDLPTQVSEGIQVGIPVDAQMVTFTSTDGTVLQGVYYPPETGPSPVVVLMHQYPLDHETEWFAIAPWLQNRGLTDTVIRGEMPWGDPDWFPVVPDDLKVGVFIFTFRGCKGGCQNAGFSIAEGAVWAEDARAALLTAATLPGADAGKIIAVGTSIGADGAVDGCLLAEEDGLHCAGAMSWSPGSYLKMPFGEAVGSLTEAGIPVRCFAGEGDNQSAETCRSYSGDGYEIEIDPSGNHGIDLVNPDLNIDTLNLLLVFLRQIIFN